MCWVAQMQVKGRLTNGFPRSHTTAGEQGEPLVRLFLAPLGPVVVGFGACAPRLRDSMVDYADKLNWALRVAVRGLAGVISVLMFLCFCVPSACLNFQTIALERIGVLSKGGGGHERAIASVRNLNDVMKTVYTVFIFLPMSPWLIGSIMAAFLRYQRCDWFGVAGGRREKLASPLTPPPTAPRRLPVTSRASASFPTSTSTASNS